MNDMVEASPASDWAATAAWLTVAGEQCIEAIAEEQLVAMFTQRFDLERFEALVQDGSWPSWLDDLAARELPSAAFRDLRDQHPASGLLRMLTTRHAGDGVAAHAHVTCDTFLVNMGRQLHACVAHDPNAQQALDALASASEVHCFVSLLLIRQLARESSPHAHILAHSAERLYSAAVAHFGAHAHRLYLASAGPLAPPPTLHPCCLSILSSQDVSPGDLHKLVALMHKGVSLAPLRLPALYRLLLVALFDATQLGRRTQEERDSLAQVVAAASEGDCDAKASGGGGARVEGATGGVTGGGEGDGSGEGDQGAGGGDGSSRRQSLLDSLRVALDVCSANAVASISADSAELARHLHWYPVACGVLTWAHSNMTRNTATRFNSDLLPSYLKLLIAAAAAQPQLRQQVCAVLTEVLSLDAADGTDAWATISMKQQIVDCMLVMMLDGCVGQVLAAIEESLSTADLAIIRHSVLSLVSVCAPPWSEAFASRVCRLLGHERVRDGFKAARDREPLASALHRVAQAQPALEQTIQTLLAHGSAAR